MLAGNADVNTSYPGILLILMLPKRNTDMMILILIYELEICFLCCICISLLRISIILVLHSNYLQ